MSRRPTFSELRWPIDPDALRLAQAWASGIADQALDWTWRAFDELNKSHLVQIDLQQPLEQLERDLTSKHFAEIQRLWMQESEGYVSFAPIHEWPEMESRPPAPGKPPAYDLGFVCYANERIAWPIEAKVVRTPKSLSLYLDDVVKFVSGTAAPFVGEGGLLAYLLTGRDVDFFGELAPRLGQSLEPVTQFSSRSHRVSHHARASAPTLRLHHLVMRWNCQNGVTSCLVTRSA